MSIEPLLTELLAESAEAMDQRARNAFGRIAAPFEDRIVLFGTGNLGRLVLGGLRAAGIEPLAFCDNNARLWGSRVEGVAVLPPAEALAAYNGSAAFVVAVYNSSAPRRQLRELGCARVVPYLALYWRFWQSMPEEDRLALPHRILAGADAIREGYELLTEEQSRREFRAQIRWRCLLDYDCLPAPDDPREMYFPSGLVKMLPEEVFVDCGAFDGDSIRGFLAATGGRFRRIHAFEADPLNIEALGRYLAGLPAEVAGRIAIVPCAVGERDGTVRFRAGGLAGSKISESAEAGEVVTCRSLDSGLAGAAPTFIKMDIEGAEPEALRGARRTMAECRPVMAVCAYHRSEHLWEIPKLLRAANPDYEIRLRRYAEECWELVYYAIPPERLVARRGEAA